ncbi:alpha-L-arabinofuranosidase C-terminal domain-containing protein [uncultured Chitinophaga sp.]|uniref:alpha-N-arabinofuranosidase n=1 Tax=uncultured Chitinophaga sp. TaxID=339340 RepID=UPI0025CB83CD|nr:alpha-L-arabinofuranosidase C-terminal domain-containing protein [uncultured Chitinophaga sp.]
MKKTILLAAVMAGAVISTYAQNPARLLVNAHAPKETISRHIYGHFSEHLGRCIYDGFWVADSMQVPKKDRIRLDVVDALKKIKVPNLRWPGGCFADEYHWRDGIGPRENRPKMVNSSWGNVTEDNSFGTHEFLELCELIGCDPYISANVGSGTVQEMNNWVEYLNFDGLSPITDTRKKNGRDKPWKVQFWGVGNESWGCGGNMTPEYYAGEYRRYATFCKNYPGVALKKIVSGANSNDYNWTEVMMRNIPLGMMWGVSLHHYTVPKTWREKGSATQFDEKEYFLAMNSCLKMEELINRHSTIMDKYDPGKRVALVVDEWGIWTDVEPGTNPAFLYQQNSMRDAIIAGTTLNIFNNHADRVKMAELAQTVNVLQSVILTKGRQMVLTPTYHIFDLYKVHQDAKLLPVQLSAPDYSLGGDKLAAVNVSASQDASGAIHISFVNIDPNKDITIRTSLNGANWKTIDGQIMTSPKFTDINSFEEPNKVKPAAFKGAKKEGNDLTVTLPKLSVVVLELK